MSRLFLPIVGFFCFLVTSFHSLLILCVLGSSGVSTWVSLFTLFSTSGANTLLWSSDCWDPGSMFIMKSRNSLKEGALKWFFEEICNDCSCGTVLYFKFSRIKLVSNKEIVDVEVACALAAWCVSILLQQDCALVILVYNGINCTISLCFKIACP